MKRHSERNENLFMIFCALFFCARENRETLTPELNGMETWSVSDAELTPLSLRVVLWRVAPVICSLGLLGVSLKCVLESVWLPPDFHWSTCVRCGGLDL